jgi:hypothetical protein
MKGHVHVEMMALTWFGWQQFTLQGPKRQRLHNAHHKSFESRILKYCVCVFEKILWCKKNRKEVHDHVVKRRTS